MIALGRLKTRGTGRSNGLQIHDPGRRQKDHCPRSKLMRQMNGSDEQDAKSEEDRWPTRSMAVMNIAQERRTEAKKWRDTVQARREMTLRCDIMHARSAKGQNADGE